MPAHQLGDHSYFVYVTVEGIDDFYGELVGNDVILTQTLADKPCGMRAFGIRLQTTTGSCSVRSSDALRITT
jgi:hypothetical protein